MTGVKYAPRVQFCKLNPNIHDSDNEASGSGCNPEPASADHNVSMKAGHQMSGSPALLRVLIAEDSEDDLILLMHELRRGGYEMTFLRVDDGDALRDALKERWDLVISDYMMPKISGLDVVKAVRETGLDLPVIIVSGLMGEDFAVTAMKAGADDYILKDRLFRLVPAVERELRYYETKRAHRRDREEVFLLNSLLETIAEVNKMLVRETDRQRIMDEACRILVEKSGFRMSWIGRADLDSGEVAPLAAAGGKRDCLQLIRVRCDESPLGMGPTGRAIRTGKQVVCPDMERCEDAEPWMEGAMRFGLKGCAAFPLFIRGSVFGSMSVYSGEAGAFNERMISLLESLAGDIGFALQSIDEAEEHKKAVVALRDSEKRLRTIFESSMDGMFVIDMQGRYVDVNISGCRMVGYSRDEILASDVRLLIFPERESRLDEHRALWKKGGFVPEMPLRKRDGTTVWVDLAITPFKVGDRELVLGVKRDITARKNAEEALRESEERFRQIFEQNQDAQILLAYEGMKVMDANPAAVELFGYTAEELVGEDVPPFMTGDLLSRLKPAGSKPWSRLEMIEARRKDSSKVTVSITGQTIKLNEGMMVLCTIKDLTEILRMEEEARLMQAKLIHANKMTSIGTLASGVAHEINNPNNFILFNSTLLSDAWNDARKILDGYYRENGDFSLGGLPYSEMSDVVPELLSGITEGSRRIKGIVDNLKDFSRTDRANPEGELDVNRAVLAAVSMLSSQIMKSTDCLKVSCAEGLPPVKGSSQKIEQVVINLVLNALNALPDREKGVFVSTWHDAEAGQVVIEVKDEGAGMTREVLERITEPFFTTRGDAGGTGLGLSISYSIVKEHRGMLEFDSEPGKGTTARLRLPVLMHS